MTASLGGSTSTLRRAAVELQPSRRDETARRILASRRPRSGQPHCRCSGRRRASSLARPGSAWLRARQVRALWTQLGTARRYRSRARVVGRCVPGNEVPTATLPRVAHPQRAAVADSDAAVPENAKERLDGGPPAFQRQPVICVGAVAFSRPPGVVAWLLGDPWRCCSHKSFGHRFRSRDDSTRGAATQGRSQATRTYAPPGGRCACRLGDRLVSIDTRSGVMRHRRSPPGSQHYGHHSSPALPSCLLRALCSSSPLRVSHTPTEPIRMKPSAATPKSNHARMPPRTPNSSVV